ncbi:Uncharacterised protein [Bifidobacterium adolescentis]|uniref:Uncharacterized protein n=1 Tax=Bifidobacterium adolescentis TaxID=1680 RepID=A0A174D0H8_BIFAD|nr:unknown [Bifidobacterium adolescentis CAG:119]CUN76042.1 Uncharacterised protein [Bifidobacterium adolescentis]CUN82923.1 Uncharacterised protein [Bifidobacterium adolescentis]CUO18923.1 Uncharacterised protein [Bifidobacterium adolescentis]
MEFGRYTRGSSLAAPCAISMELSQSAMLASFPALKLMVFLTPMPTLLVLYCAARFCFGTSTFFTVTEALSA